MSILYTTVLGLIGVVLIALLNSGDELLPQPAATIMPHKNETLVQAAPPVELTGLSATTINTDGSDWYKVEGVIDGDTIKLTIGETIETVRLIGVDTPETVHPSQPVECFGKEASKKTGELLSGTMVIIEKDLSQNERDKYGRLLAYVFLPDGTNLNQKLIADGYAYEYTYNLPYKYQSEFKQAETDARNSKRGLWAEGVCNAEAQVVTAVPVVNTPVNHSPSQCDSNYTGACVPIASDVDCAGGSGNGPAYVSGPVYIVGVDVYGLDRDKDGVACER